jgi:hypothetical protein
MSYAHDPYWAYKQGWDPERRQAYENQVMMDRAAEQQHRAEFDAGAIITSGVLLGGLFMSRAARKAAKARAQWVNDHYPEDYPSRKAEMDATRAQLESETVQTIATLTAEIATLEGRLPHAGTAKTVRTLRTRIDALQARIDGARLAFTQALDALKMRYLDIVEYEEGLARLS